MPFNISFLSDLGALDAAVVRAVLHGLAPEARVLDIDHGLPPYDLRAAGFALLQIIQYLPEGALIVAVDPRAGHPEQRYIAVQAGELTIFAPDNGVIASAVGLLGGSTESVELNNAEHHLGGFAPTFAARDILAPSAAAFANGTALTELGTLVDPNSLVPALMNLPTEEDNQCTGAVWNIDRFGNCALNIDPASLVEHGVQLDETVEVETPGGVRRARFGVSFAELNPSELGLGIDATGLMVLWMPAASAARELKLQSSSPVTLRWKGR